jgi:hypothetical protein
MDGQRIGDENANGNNEWKRRTSITSLNWGWRLNVGTSWFIIIPEI